MYFNFIGVTSPECVTTDDEFYYLYSTTDEKIRRKYFRRKDGILEEKCDQYVMPLADTRRLTQSIFEQKGLDWKEEVPVYSSLEFKGFFLSI